MRFKIVFSPVSSPVISINYYYSLSTAIYKFLDNVDSKKTSILHDKGIKKFKPWTFSKIRIPDVRLSGSELWGAKKTTWYFFFSGLDSICELLQRGIEKNKFFRIGASEFEVKKVVCIPEPIYTNHVRCVTLSPIFCSQRLSDQDGKWYHSYLMPDNPNIGDALHETLVAKHLAIGGNDLSREFFNIEFDREYISRRKNISKLITIKKGKPDESRLRVFDCPFVLQAHSELVKTAWTCGVGKSTSLGLGMIDFNKKGLDHGA